MNKTRIKSFEVSGLFGTDNVLIPFNDDGIKILVGENGSGKTQILNLFYFFLTANFFRLNDFNFSKLKLTFFDNNTLEISKEEIKDFIEQAYNNPDVKEFISEYGVFQFEILRNRFLTESLYEYL